MVISISFFFDLGGVIFNYKDGFAKLSRAIGRAEASVERAYLKHVDLAARGKISTDEFWINFQNELSLSQDNGIESYAEFWTSSFSAITETHALMRELSGIYTLGIISNTEFGVFEQALSKGHIPAVAFSLVIRSCEVGFLKPEREIYLLAQEGVKASPNQILFIDDKEENIRAAISLGWQGVVFDENNPQKSIREIKKVLI